MSFRIGKIFGVTIRLHYSLILIFLLIVWSLSMGYMPQQYPDLPQLSYWIIGIISGIILLLSVLIHELCHSVVANRLGTKINRITLFFLGGAAELTEEPKNPNVEFQMAIAGPLSSFALAAFFGALWYIFQFFGSISELIAVTQYSATINLILGAFNLLPAFPLDGGRIFRAIIWSRNKSIIQATKTASKVGVALSYMLMFGGFILMFFGGLFNGLWIIFIGWFIKSSAEAGLSQTIISQVLANTTVEEIMSKDVMTIDSQVNLDDLIKNYFLVRKYAGYPVVRDGSVLGLITMENVKKIPEQKWNETTVEQVMLPLNKLVQIDPKTPASDAMFKMSTHGLGRLLVMEEGNLKGIISRKDLTHLIKARVEFEKAHVN